MKDGPGGIAFG